MLNKGAGVCRLEQENAITSCKQGLSSLQLLVRHSLGRAEQDSASLHALGMHMVLGLQANTTDNSITAQGSTKHLCGQALARCSDRKKAMTLSQAFPVSTEPLNTVAHSLLASFLPQQLRQQEAAAAEAEEKEEMEIADGKQLASKRGSGAAKGRTRA